MRILAENLSCKQGDESNGEPGLSAVTQGWDPPCPVCSRTDSWLGLQEPLEIPAAAAAASLQSCLTLCDSRDGSPPGSPVPGILQARTLEWGAIAFSARDP